MGRPVRTACAVAVFALFPAVGRAQQVVTVRAPTTGGLPGSAMLDESPAAFGVRGWRVGEWARYSVTQNLGSGVPLAHLRTMSVVGRRGELFWVEIQEEMTGMATGQMPVRKRLVPFGPASERSMVEQLTLRPDSSIRRETVVRPGQGARVPAGFARGWTRVGEDSVTTPAGPFRAVHYRKGSEELWASGAVGPLGLVRYRSEDVEIELVARGETGARSRIPTGGPE